MSSSLNETTRPGDGPAPIRWVRKNLLFIVTVVVPTLLAVIYYGLIASDLYISESTFVTRSPQEQQQATGIAGIVSTAIGGISEAPLDAMAVNSFIVSRDALRKLDAEIDLKSYYSNPRIDFLHRFGFFPWEHGFEDFYEYYRKRVTSTFEASRAISMLRVEAFSAEMAARINEDLLAAAEEKVNQLNERARRDLIDYASREVANAEARVLKAERAVSEFRVARRTVDPEKQTTFHYELINKLQAELVDANTQIAQLEKLAPGSSAPAPLKLRARTLEDEIQKEIAKVAGGENSLAQLAADYEKLSIERQFAEKQLAGALAALQDARDQAQRQMIYIERIAQPSRPDVATEPKRLRGVISALVLGLVTWGVASMLIAGIKEHQT